MRRYLFLLAMALVLVAPALAANCDHATLWWKLDNAAAPAVDACGLINSNMTSGSVTWQQSPLANFSTFSTMYEDTAADYVGVGGRPSFNYFTGRNFSAAAIVRWSAADMGTDGAPLARFGSDANTRQWDFSKNIPNLLYWSTRNNASGTYCQVSYAVLADKDYHMVGTYDYNTRNLTLWINASAVATTTCAVGYHLNEQSGNNEITVGDSKTSTYEPFDGNVDEVLIFYGYTLSKTEIQNLFSYGDIDGASVGVTMTVTPNGAPVNEATTLLATPSGNGSAPTYWRWNVSYNSSYTIIDNNVSQQTFSFTPNVTGNWSVNVTATFAGTNSTVLENVTVTQRPNASFTIFTPTAPYFINVAVNFNDTSNYTSTFNGGSADFSPGSAWNWHWNDSTANTTTVNASHTFTAPGIYRVCLGVNNSVGVGSSPDYCANITVTGFLVDAFDELTMGSLSNWTLVIANSTQSNTFTGRSNTFNYSNFSIPTGSITIDVSKTGYVGRTYYRTYDSTTGVDLNAYLLDTGNGLWSYFITQDSLGNTLSGVTLAFTFSNGTDTMTAGEKQTDSTGGASMWLDWRKVYTVTASLFGYTPVSKTLNPAATTYIIIMGSSSVFNFSDINDTVWTFTSPIGSEINTTGASVSAGILDPDNTITFCGLNLTYTNGTVFNSSVTTTEAHFCTNTIALAGTPAHTVSRFYALLYYNYSAGSGNGTHVYIPFQTNYSLNTVMSSTSTSGLYNQLGGDEARMMLVVLITLLSGAAAAMFLGSGAVIVMLVVSGAFIYWGWIPVMSYFSGIWLLAAVAGFAVLFLERGGG